MPWPNLLQLKAHIAWSAVGQSAMRNNLPAGGRSAMCTALAQLQIQDITAENMFEALDEQTASLRLIQLELAPNTDRTFWGPSRKALNLFLRDCCYNHWLRAAYNLDRIEPMLELPLDGRTMAQLRQYDPTLPRVGIRHLTAEMSNHFQQAASTLSDSDFGMARVHLDALWWHPEVPQND